MANKTHLFPCLLLLVFLGCLVVVSVITSIKSFMANAIPKAVRAADMHAKMPFPVDITSPSDSFTFAFLAILNSSPAASLIFSAFSHSFSNSVSISGGQMS